MARQNNSKILKLAKQALRALRLNRRKKTAEKLAEIARAASAEEEPQGPPPADDEAPPPEPPRQGRRFEPPPPPRRRFERPRPDIPGVTYATYFRAQGFVQGAPFGAVIMSPPMVEYEPRGAPESPGGFFSGALLGKVRWDGLVSRASVIDDLNRALNLDMMDPPGDFRAVYDSWDYRYYVREFVFGEPGRFIMDTGVVTRGNERAATRGIP